MLGYSEMIPYMVSYMSVPSEGAGAEPPGFAGCLTVLWLWFSQALSARVLLFFDEFFPLDLSLVDELSFLKDLSFLDEIILF